MKKILTVGFVLLMLMSLSACGSQLKKEVAVNNFKEIPSDLVDGYDCLYDKWFDDDIFSAGMAATFFLNGTIDNYDLDYHNATQVILCQTKSDMRYDLLITYGGEYINYIQYWPESDKAQLGNKEIKTGITEYADKLVKAGIVERYKTIPQETLDKILYLILDRILDE